MRKTTIKEPKEIRRQILEYFQSSDDLKFAYKLQIILLLIDNKDTNCSEVARIYGKSPQTIARWVRKLNQSKTRDIEVLRNQQKPGRNTRISKDDMISIKDILKQNPSQYGIKSNRWDGITLSTFLQKKFKIKLKVRQCQRILNRLGVANKSGRPWDKRPV